MVPFIHIRPGQITAFGRGRGFRARLLSVFAISRFQLGRPRASILGSRSTGVPVAPTPRTSRSKQRFSGMNGTLPENKEKTHVLVEAALVKLGFKGNSKRTNGPPPHFDFLSHALLQGPVPVLGTGRAGSPFFRDYDPGICGENCRLALCERPVHSERFFSLASVSFAPFPGLPLALGGFKGCSPFSPTQPGSSSLPFKPIPKLG